MDKMFEDLLNGKKKNKKQKSKNKVVHDKLYKLIGVKRDADQE